MCGPSQGHLYVEVETAAVYQSPQHAIVSQGNGVEHGGQPQLIADIRVCTVVQQCFSNISSIPVNRIQCMDTESHVWAHIDSQMGTVVESCVPIPVLQDIIQRVKKEGEKWSPLQ